MIFFTNVQLKGKTDWDISKAWRDAKRTSTENEFVTIGLGMILPMLVILSAGLATSIGVNLFELRRPFVARWTKTFKQALENTLHWKCCRNN